ncbi:alpha/beta fold hydrolase [Polymorphobacter fuscus]|uniref:Alpha/beta fold hydrolase n=1 Tax=Sandarakinorhabdus fusca TaxID=1439888 RepID=A0A7C9GYH1_9SPHN|nr:alpha/beta fold hydrolase [Polymorphobacter fuscus]KAB7645518.1 alpha/beta fold hydrolase [Polymorphobacter fuscus]MQT17954.1 alpha/beta fold hydrolase [Polymorphobacter fuscus]NJC08584.1 homoserine O-acetyltransferase [Polymorphobacter fuscus]
MKIPAILGVLLFLLATPAQAWPVTEGEAVLKGFRFGTGETLDIRQHYRTLGTPRRDGKGNITNAVMVLHGTGGTGAQFLRPQFADELYGPGQPLDISRYYIILPDAIGHGGSSKPSNGMRMAFPRYDYQDMVDAQYRLLTEALQVKQLRLLMGTSMGCMMDFVWGTRHPGFARAIMPTACQAVELAGRNRIWRRMSIDAIMADPAWQGGNYTVQPVLGLRTVAALSVIAGSAPVRQQADFPTRAAAEAGIKGQVDTAIADMDANDVIYRLEASRNYNPSPELARITVPVTWINSADDFINPPGLHLTEAEVARMPNARFVLVPETADSHGHSTHTWAKFWKQELVDLLQRSE